MNERNLTSGENYGQEVFVAGREANNIERMPDVNESNPAKEIHITPVNYGYIVRVGCQTVVVEDANKLLRNLDHYLRNPQKYENEFNRTKKLIN